MKKTLTINLNQNLFNIDEDAYSKLSDYLDSIKKHFAKTQDSNEIVSDIESRIAEKFLEKIGSSKSVITIDDVKEIISSMGTVADLSRDEENEEDISENNTDWSPRKKLFRDPEDKVIGGVASGLATYFGFDTIVVRLLFIILALVPYTSGISIIGYIILLFIVPVAKNTADRLQMQGETVTLSKIEDMVNSRFSESKDSESRLSRLILLPFRVIGNFLPTLGRIIKGLVIGFSIFIGFCLVFSIALSIAGLVFALVQALVNGNILMGELSFLNSIPSPQLQIILISTFFVALFPLIFFLQLGITLMKRKSAFNLFNVLTNLFLWVIAIIVLCAASVNIAPQLSSHFNFPQIKTGYILPAVDEANFTKIEINEFDKIEVSSIYELVFNQSSETSLIAYGSAEYLSKLVVKVTDSGILKIYNQAAPVTCIGICDNRLPVKVVVSGPAINEVNVSGFTKIISENLDQDRLSFKVSGASDILLSGSIDDLFFNVSGASKISGQNLNSKSIEIKSSGASTSQFSGFSDSLVVDVSGASKVEAQSLETNTTNVFSSGASSIRVNTLNTLNVHASGASKILYAGSPDISKELSGASSVQRL